MKIEILGVEIDDLGKEGALAAISERFGNNIRTFIATPNPEMILLARKDAEFKKILNSADIKIPDGCGLKIGAKILGKKLNSRVTGTDLMKELCQWAGENDLGVYFLGGGEGAAQRAAQNLKNLFYGLKICGADGGGKMPARQSPDSDSRMAGGEDWDNRAIIAHINATKPEVLFVALGHGKQEKWIAENFKNLSTVKIAMGVGGAFDFYSGRVRRAPQFVRRLGMEWMWRLAMEPRRWKRIWNAVVIFPITCLIKKPRSMGGE